MHAFHIQNLISLSRDSHIDPKHLCITIPGPKRNARNKTMKILSDDQPHQHCRT